MTNSIDSKILILCGATASGKSAIALEIAQKTGGVIINADSQQMYRELRILTARPTPEEESLAPHRLYGTISVSEQCSAGAWLKLAKMEIDWVLAQKKLPIVVGGTGLYLKALMEGIAEIPDIATPVRDQSANDFEAMGKEAFSARLKEVDPEFFTRLQVYDKQRLIRAYAVWLGSGKPLSWWHKQSLTPPYQSDSFKIFQVDIPRDELYRRCDQRFVNMLEQGATEEVAALYSLPIRGRVGVGALQDRGPSSPPPSLPPIGGGAEKIIGVREIGTYLKGQITLEEATEKAQQATRNYAKRQLTWFRQQLENPQLIQGAAEILKNA